MKKKKKASKNVQSKWLGEKWNYTVSTSIVLFFIFMKKGRLKIAFQEM